MEPLLEKQKHWSSGSATVWPWAWPYPVWLSEESSIPVLFLPPWCWPWDRRVKEAKEGLNLQAAVPGPCCKVLWTLLLQLSVNGQGATWKLMKKWGTSLLGWVLWDKGTTYSRKTLGQLQGRAGSSQPGGAELADLQGEPYKKCQRLLPGGRWWKRAARESLELFRSPWLLFVN